MQSADRMVADRPPSFGVINLAFFKESFMDEVQLAVAGQARTGKVATADNADNRVQMVE